MRVRQQRGRRGPPLRSAPGGSRRLSARTWCLTSRWEQRTASPMLASALARDATLKFYKLMRTSLQRQSSLDARARCLQRRRHAPGRRRPREPRAARDHPRQRAARRPRRGPQAGGAQAGGGGGERCARVHTSRARAHTRRGESSALPRAPRRDEVAPVASRSRSPLGRQMRCCQAPGGPGVGVGFATDVPQRLLSGRCAGQRPAAAGQALAAEGNPAACGAHQGGGGGAEGARRARVICVRCRGRGSATGWRGWCATRRL